MRARNKVDKSALKLVALSQSMRDVLDYAIEFRMLAAESGWIQTVQLDAFLHWL